MGICSSRNQQLDQISTKLDILSNQINRIDNQVKNIPSSVLSDTVTKIIPLIVSSENNYLHTSPDGRHHRTINTQTVASSRRTVSNQQTDNS